MADQLSNILYKIHQIVKSFKFLQLPNVMTSFQAINSVSIEQRTSKTFLISTLRTDVTSDTFVTGQYIPTSWSDGAQFQLEKDRIVLS
jgi:hypothetical protein